MHVETWFGMDETRRKVYLKQFRQLTPKDMEAKKGITINELNNEILYCVTSGNILNENNIFSNVL